MSATLALQGAIVSQLEEVPQLSRVFHDAPARAHFPYAVLNCSDERDWSCTGRQGREIMLQVVLWDDQPSRLLSLEALVEMELEKVAVPAAWHLSTLVLTGKRRSCDPGGPWSCTIEMRARLMAQGSEDER